MRSEPALEDRRVQLCQVADRLDVVVGQRPAGARADAPQPLDGQWRQEGRLPAGRHDHQTVRLAVFRGDLRDEPVGRDADRHGQLDLVADVLLDAPADCFARPEQRLRAGQIEERLVDRDLLDDRRVAAQDRHYLLADAAVLAAVNGHEDQLRTQGDRRAGRHGRANAIWPRLVAGGHHDSPAARSATNGNRLAAQRVVVALLDGRVERVQINVQDGSRPRVVAHIKMMRRAEAQLACHGSDIGSMKTLEAVPCPTSQVASACFPAMSSSVSLSE